MKRIIYVVVGYNNLLGITGTVGAGTTRGIAERIQREHDYMLDKSTIMEVILEDE